MDTFGSGWDDRRTENPISKRTRPIHSSPAIVISFGEFKLIKQSHWRQWLTPHKRGAHVSIRHQKAIPKQSIHHIVDVDIFKFIAPHTKFTKFKRFCHCQLQHRRIVAISKTPKRCHRHSRRPYPITISTLRMPLTYQTDGDANGWCVKRMLRHNNAIQQPLPF